MKKTGIIIVGIGIIIIGAGFLFQQGINLKGTGYSSVATSSSIEVGPQENKTLFAKDTACSSRIISTVASPIMLSFHSDITPTGKVGHLQGASTTVAYDSGLYGCKAITAYGFSSTTITTSYATQ